MGKDFFISYWHGDVAIAERVRAGLEARGTACWMAPGDIAAGQEWAAAIVAGIASCRALVLIVSAGAVHSRQIEREVALADSHGLSILALRVAAAVEVSSGLAYYLGDLQWVDGVGEAFEAGVCRLAAAVARSVIPPTRDCSGFAPFGPE